MLVTDKQFFMEKKLVAKLDLMVKRMQGTDDNLVCIDGDEGQGKSNLAAGLCYYVAYKMGRTYNPKENIFFDLEELIEKASSTEEQILHWDEGALGGMSTQWWMKNQQKFIQLIMVARKKKHFIVICIPRFYKLNEYILVDRSIALIHVYARKNIYKGRFIYYTKRKKELLVEDWRRKHIKNYYKHKSFMGSFGKYMERVFNKKELKDYEAKKDFAILNLGKVTKPPSEAELKKKLIMNAILKNEEKDRKEKITQKELARLLNISRMTITNYMREIRSAKNKDANKNINFGSYKGD